MSARFDGETYARLAVELHEKGYNCAQSVFLAFAPAGGLNELEARKLMQTFGGGMGGLGEACGALCGALAALGLLMDPVTPGDQLRKDESYLRARILGERFRAGAGALHCPDLKKEDPEERKAACCGYIALAARLAAEALS